MFKMIHHAIYVALWSMGDVMGLPPVTLSGAEGEEHDAKGVMPRQ